MNPETAEQKDGNLPHTPGINGTSDTIRIGITEAMLNEENPYNGVDGSCKGLIKKKGSDVMGKKNTNKEGYTPSWDGINGD